MQINLLYKNKDWTNVKSYYDWSNMVKDLRLDVLINASTRDVVYKNGKVAYLQHEDKFLAEAMRKIMSVPLETEDEILYRQKVLKDCFNREGFVQELYEMTEDTLEKWNKLGRRNKASSGRDNKAALITEIRVLKLLISSVAEIKQFLKDNIFRLESEGFTGLYDRLSKDFNDEYQDKLFQIMEDLSFYVDVSEVQVGRNVFKSSLPFIEVDCGIKDGLKLGDFKLESLETVYKTLRNPNGIVAKIQGTLDSMSPNFISLYKDTTLQDNASELEYQVVSYVVSCCNDFMNEYGQFFDQLHLQLGFYCGAINLRHQMQRFDLDYSYPKVGAAGELSYEELKELVLGIEKQGSVVGNTDVLNSKKLTIVTGANQGGKSTFLRSLGIAQVMMQCGLIVCAKSFVSDIYPGLFTHFTRREDSAMNSGRLDEELRRMSHIINHLEPKSLILLNESFASTTEIEGSHIAYEIIKALVEEGVKIITVTHLLSFAKKVYEEEKSNPDSQVVFLSAERLESGERTFKMKSHEPELTSFGLDLFNQIIKK